MAEPWRIAWQNGYRSYGWGIPPFDDQANVDPVVKALRDQLRPIGTVRDLHRHYGQDVNWVQQTAEQLCPARGWSFAELALLRDAVYGTRYFEIGYGKEITLPALSSFNTSIRGVLTRAQREASRMSCPKIHDLHLFLAVYQALEETKDVSNIFGEFEAGVRRLRVAIVNRLGRPTQSPLGELPLTSEAATALAAARAVAPNEREGTTVILGLLDILLRTSAPVGDVLADLGLETSQIQDRLRNLLG